MGTKIAFIIAHKYYRGYTSYIEYYITNIKRYYDDALIIVVDNNSVNKKDIFDGLKKYDVTLLDNGISCKFEIGAYQVGMRYLIDSNLLDAIDYCVFTQDNFILKNRLDFNLLKDNGVTACPINSWSPDRAHKDICQTVLSGIGLYNNMDKITFCWCNSFIVANSKVAQLYGYFKTIVITTRIESCASERYLARILWELNGHKNNDIDGDIIPLKYLYDCWKVDPRSNISGVHFVKVVQQKNEKTVDKY